MARSNSYRMRIAFSDCDPAQIVFFAHYFKWFDTASNEFFRACGVPAWRELSATCGIVGMPLVDAQAKFMNPATYGEDIVIESAVEEWRTKSFVMRHVACRGETVLCEGREIRVFVTQDPDNPLCIEAVPVPEAIRAACE